MSFFYWEKVIFYIDFNLTYKYKIEYKISEKTLI